MHADCPCAWPCFQILVILPAPSCSPAHVCIFCAGSKAGQPATALQQQASGKWATSLFAPLRLDSTNSRNGGSDPIELQSIDVDAAKAASASAAAAHTAGLKNATGAGTLSGTAILEGSVSPHRPWADDLVRAALCHPHALCAACCVSSRSARLCMKKTETVVTLNTCTHSHTHARTHLQAFNPATPPCASPLMSWCLQSIQATHARTQLCTHN